MHPGTCYVFFGQEGNFLDSSGGVQSEVGPYGVYGLTCGVIYAAIAIELYR